MMSRFGKSAAAKPEVKEEIAAVQPAVDPAFSHDRPPGGGIVQELSEGSRGPEPAGLRSSRVEVEHYTTRNWGGRHENEDRIMCYKDEIPSHRPAFDLVGVLDGHDTETASDMVSQRLPGEVSGRLKKGDTIAEANTASMAKLENDLKSLTSSAGTCVLSCAIAGRFVWCANLGDCRSCLVGLVVPEGPAASSSVPTGPAVMKPKVSSFTWMSQDHKAANPAERARVLAAGGMMQDGRVEGLEPLRTLGDFDVKAQVNKGVISTIPEVRRHELVPIDPTKPAQAVLVCATDGVWDCMEAKDIMDLIRARKEICKLQLAMAKESGDPRKPMNKEVLRELAEDLVQFSIAKGSRDDCTAVVAFISVPPTSDGTTATL